MLATQKVHRCKCVCSAKSRTDRLLSNLGYCSRSECKPFLAKRLVTEEGKRITSCSQKVTPERVLVDGVELDHPEGLLLALNKPTGYICTHDTTEGAVVYELLPQQWLARKPGITTVGRLDKDTCGLLLITTLSNLVHKLTSPKHHILKRYRVELASTDDADSQDKMVNLFASGELTLRGETSPCLPAELHFSSDNHCEVALSEGRYHQVRRMFAACGAHVQALQRASIGSLELDALDLQEGEWVHLPLDTFDVA